MGNEELTNSQTWAAAERKGDMSKYEIRMETNYSYTTILHMYVTIETQGKVFRLYLSVYKTLWVCEKIGFRW